jgi:geranylgeranyl pyrophosphate synthase
MRHALKGEQSREGSRWLSLPLLCCQAAGGESQRVVAIAAAWYLFYGAAHIMDSVEDQDEPESWWGEAGPRAALSAATGIYFTACQALNRLDVLLEDCDTAREIREGMLNRFMQMGSGQHFDLIQPRITLDQYWQIARAKSGTFFAMACWAGARAGTSHKETLESLEKFGLEFGLLVQILDDLKEFQNLGERLNEGKPASLLRSLPVVYVLEVGPDKIKRKLLDLLRETYTWVDAADEIVQIIDENGGALYLTAELGRHRQGALNELVRSRVAESGRLPLMALLDELYTPV